MLERWLEAPALIVETSLLDRAASINATGLPQDTLLASADQQSEAAINEVVAQFTRALPLLTGGQFTAFSAVSAQTTAPGAEVSSVNLGAIMVVRYARGRRRVPRWTSHARPSPAITCAPDARISCSARAESPAFRSTPAIASASTVTSSPARRASSTECLTQ